MNYSFRCPCCEGELMPLGEEERKRLLAEFGADGIEQDSEADNVATGEASAKPTDIPKGVITGKELVFTDGYARTREFGWDGKTETMPKEWIGCGYYVISSYSICKSHGKERLIVNGCVNRNQRNIKFGFCKDAYSPTIYRTIEDARDAMRILSRDVLSQFADVRFVNEDLAESVSRDGELSYKYVEVIPVEEYHPIRRRDVLEEFRREHIAEMQAKGKEDAGAKSRAGAIRRGEEQAKWRTELQERKERNGCFDDRIDDWLGGFKKARVSGGRVNTGAAMLGNCSNDCDESDVEKPVRSEIVEDWSNVDWDEEDRESRMLGEAVRENEFDMPWMRAASRRIKDELADIRRTRMGMATVKSTEKWLLQDWETYKYVRCENGRATLVEQKDSTYFERLQDANQVVLDIERRFWDPEYVKWRLHVVPYKDDEKH